MSFLLSFPFFFRKVRKREKEVNSSKHSRERQDRHISPLPLPLTQARSDSVRNVIERLSLSECAIKLRLLLESELLVASVPKRVPRTLVYTIEYVLHIRAHRLSDYRHRETEHFRVKLNHERYTGRIANSL